MFKFKLYKGTSRLCTLVLAVWLAGATCASAQTLTTLYSFGSRPGDGVDPQAGVVFDKAGNLYGSTAVGGVSGANGIVFELSPSGGGSWTEAIPTRFQGNPDGKIPECRLIVTSTGKLFGTTLEGGTSDLGTAFELVPPASSGGSWKKQVIYSFGSFSGDGVNPNAGLLAASPGFYGVTFAGGANGKGAVFQLTPPTASGNPWTETILYSFAASGDAAFPSSELVRDKNGNLYGTTTLGGANNLGAVYEVSPPAAVGNSWTETVIFSFSGTDGTLPAGRLLLDASGTLYGTTDGGGAGQEGTVFQLVPLRHPRAGLLPAAGPGGRGLQLQPRRVRRALPAGHHRGANPGDLRDR